MMLSVETGESEPQRHRSEPRRRADRERNRQAVVDALLDLISEGNLAPSAEAIAARAGVSRRSIFRYFDDLADLQRAAIQRQLERLGALLTADLEEHAPASERVRAFVQRRLRLYEAGGPAMRVTRMRAPLNPVFAEQLRAARQHFADEVRRVFSPELSPLSEPERQRTVAMVDAVASFETCEVLQGSHGLHGEELEATLTAAIARLLGIDTPDASS